MINHTECIRFSLESHKMLDVMTICRTSTNKNLKIQTCINSHSIDKNDEGSTVKFCLLIYTNSNSSINVSPIHQYSTNNPKNIIISKNSHIYSER